MRYLLTIAALVHLSAAPTPAAPDGAAYRHTPLSSAETQWLEGRWEVRGMGDMGAFEFHRSDDGMRLRLEYKANETTVVAEGKIYLTRHGEDVFINLSYLEREKLLEELRKRLKPFGSKADAPIDEGCFTLVRIRRRSDGGIEMREIDPDLTLTANPQLKRDRPPAHRHCDTAFLFGLSPAEQARLVLIPDPDGPLSEPLYRIGSARTRQH